MFFLIIKSIIYFSEILIICIFLKSSFRILFRKIYMIRINEKLKRINTNVQLYSSVQKKTIDQI